MGIIVNADEILHRLVADSCNILWLGCGLFVASALETVLWKTRFFKYLNRPIHQAWFGANKRWRGLLSLPLANMLSTLLFQLVESVLKTTTLLPISIDFILFSDFNGLDYGLLVGFVFNLAELPNSFIKRRLKIPPGDESSLAFYIVDHVDSPFGTLALWYFYFNFPLPLITLGVVIAPPLSMGATWVRKQLGLK